MAIGSNQFANSSNYRSNYNDNSNNGNKEGEDDSNSASDKESSIDSRVKGEYTYIEKNFISQYLYYTKQ